MKLLSPLANKTANQEQTLRNILRTQELEKAAAKARQSLALAESEFNSRLAKNRQTWANEEEAHFKRISQMAIEVNTLEARRQNALIPVKFLEEAAQANMDKAIAYQAALEAKEQRLDALADKLEDALDLAGKKLTDNSRREIELNLRQDGIERQLATTLAATKDLNAKMAEFTNYQTGVYKDLDQRKTELVLIERSLIARDGQLKDKDRQLNQLGLKLKDQRQAIDDAWGELKQRQLSP